MMPTPWTPFSLFRVISGLGWRFSQNWILSFCLLEIRIFNKQIKFDKFSQFNYSNNIQGSACPQVCYTNGKYVCLQCCLCNLVSFKIFSWDEETSARVYLYCSLEHKCYHNLPNLTSCIDDLETNGGGETAGGVSTGQGTIMSALLGHWSVIAALVLLCGCIRR